MTAVNIPVNFCFRRSSFFIPVKRERLMESDSVKLYPYPELSGALHRNVTTNLSLLARNPARYGLVVFFLNIIRFELHAIAAYMRGEPFQVELHGLRGGAGPA